MTHPIFYERLLKLDPFASRETFHKLEQFVSLLHKWNKAINLVHYASLQELWERHILNSAEFLRYIPTGSRVITDFGSGGGFPGIILAILGKWDIHLIESDSRKCAFLTEASQFAQGLITIHNARIENLTPWDSDVLTARALAPLTDLIPLTLPFIKKSKICLYLKGQNSVKEIEETKKDHYTLALAYRVYPSLLSPHSNIISIQEEYRNECPTSSLSAN